MARRETLLYQKKYLEETNVLLDQLAVLNSANTSNRSISLGKILNILRQWITDTEDLRSKTTVLQLEEAQDRIQMRAALP